MIRRFVIWMGALCPCISRKAPDQPGYLPCFDFHCFNPHPSDVSTHKGELPCRTGWHWALHVVLLHVVLLQHWSLLQCTSVVLILQQPVIPQTLLIDDTHSFRKHETDCCRNTPLEGAAPPLPLRVSCCCCCCCCRHCCCLVLVLHPACAVGRFGRLQGHQHSNAST
jgi:hypothetical protein